MPDQLLLTIFDATMQQVYLKLLTSSLRLSLASLPISATYIEAPILHFLLHVTMLLMSKTPDT